MKQQEMVRFRLMVPDRRAEPDSAVASTAAVVARRARRSALQDRVRLETTRTMAESRGGTEATATTSGADDRRAAADAGSQATELVTTSGDRLATVEPAESAARQAATDEVTASSQRHEASDEPPLAPATPVLSPELANLKARIHQARSIYRNRMVNTRDQSAWSIMHSFIAYGTEKKLRIGGPNGRAVNAIGWLCYNYPSRNQRLFYLDGGKIQGRLGPGYQGHEGQFLAMLAQSRVNINYPMKIEGRDFTIADLVQREMETCRSGQELTFKLIGLAYYLDADETWRNEQAQMWDLERIVKEELHQPITGAACGGTHRLFGLTCALRRQEKLGRPITGMYQRVADYLRDYRHYAFRLQNYDGSFSTEIFAGRGADPDLKKRLLTTGHVTEWMAFSLPEDELHRPQMVKAVNYLVNLLLRHQQEDLDVGPLGHSLHALAIYDERALQVAAGTSSLAALSDAAHELPYAGSDIPDTPRHVAASDDESLAKSRSRRSTRRER